MSLRLLLLFAIVAITGGCQTKFVIAVERPKSGPSLELTILEKLNPFFVREGFRPFHPETNDKEHLGTWSKPNGNATFLYGQAILYVSIYKENARVVVVVEKLNGQPGVDRMLADRVANELSGISADFPVTIKERTVYGPSLR